MPTENTFSLCSFLCFCNKIIQFKNPRKPIFKGQAVSVQAVNLNNNASLMLPHYFPHTGIQLFIFPCSCSDVSSVSNPEIDLVNSHSTVFFFLSLIKLYILALTMWSGI